ncbi:MAG: N-acetylgalactosamine 6-sulfate sulfatase, partial [Planctomycetaceae bacterium]|nr:N-acetylgalactosamine 6-sulfate sulfatase [Planctomycetaceae bacterium]
DPGETQDASASFPEIATRMQAALTAWNASVERSIAGHDYPEGRVDPPDPGPLPWNEAAEYQPFLESWKQRPEFKSWLK